MDLSPEESGVENAGWRCAYPAYKKHKKSGDLSHRFFI
ncbi:hypothetical protein GBAG_3229 [Buttiauxella agrestis ATCC 33320]|uniref:Uncharacterized protein n=1 Tax=Buttiauxella agrestis ATCC 33320 TaxID=1006004 RepID=A0A085G4F1_9ENTR|nr:hypothetical protein GBAG_3229 [Buttiauxella agrestis ATCC 33320]